MSIASTETAQQHLPTARFTRVVGIGPSTAAHRPSAPAKPLVARAPASTGQDLLRGLSG